MSRGCQVLAMPNQVGPSPFADVRIVAIDLDGVVYQGNSMIAGANASIRRLRRSGLRVVFATNNSVRTRAEIAAKLASMGIPAEEADVFTSAYVAGRLIGSMGAKTVLVIGADGLNQEVARAGATIVSEPPCNAVVVGMDTAFSYTKIQLAMDAISGNATFIACNRDGSFPTDNGRMSPGCGPMVAAIEAAMGFPAHHVAGKPSVLMLDIIASSHNLRPHEVMVVGDGIESDIAMATAYGSPSVLVAPAASACNSRTPEPTCTVRSLADLQSLPGLKPGF